jgi:hypothetical protein
MSENIRTALHGASYPATLASRASRSLPAPARVVVRRRTEADLPALDLPAMDVG